MVNLPKLAGTFEAVRLTVGVDPIDLGSFIARCHKAGIIITPTPKIQDGWIHCRVTLPKASLPGFGELMKGFAAQLNSETIHLMCPLPSQEA